MKGFFGSLMSVMVSMGLLGSMAWAQQPNAHSESKSVKVMLNFYESKSDIAARQGPDAKKYWDGWAAYGKAMSDAGIVRGGGVFTPGEAKSVKVVAGKSKVSDHAYLDSKGELGGFFIIETQSLQSALDWASKAPCAEKGVVELRVLPVMPGM